MRNSISYPGITENIALRSCEIGGASSGKMRFWTLLCSFKVFMTFKLLLW